MEIRSNIRLFFKEMPKGVILVGALSVVAAVALAHIPVFHSGGMYKDMINMTIKTGRIVTITGAVVAPIFSIWQGVDRVYRENKVKKHHLNIENEDPNTEKTDPKTKKTDRKTKKTDSKKNENPTLLSKDPKMKKEIYQLSDDDD